MDKKTSHDRNETKPHAARVADALGGVASSLGHLERSSTTIDVGWTRESVEFHFPATAEVSAESIVERLRAFIVLWDDVYAKGTNKT